MASQQRGFFGRALGPALKGVDLPRLQPGFKSLSWAKSKGAALPPGFKRFEVARRFARRNVFPRSGQAC